MRDTSTIRRHKHCGEARENALGPRTGWHMPVCLPVVPCRGIRAQEAGLAHVGFREGDAQAPAFPDVSVHVVVSSSVIFFLPDPLEALRNWRRVLKPGGRVLFSMFG